jgi:hypothetical protein
MLAARARSTENLEQRRLVRLRRAAVLEHWPISTIAWSARRAPPGSGCAPPSRPPAWTKSYAT